MRGKRVTVGRRLHGGGTAGKYQVYITDIIGHRAEGGEIQGARWPRLGAGSEVDRIRQSMDKKATLRPDPVYTREVTRAG